VEIIKRNDLSKAAAVIKSGGVICYPTDTVWGIGCNALNEAAVAKVKTVKGKPENAKLIWLLPCIGQVKKYFPNISILEQKLLNKKRTTVVLKTDGGGAAVRVVKTGWVNKFVACCGVPVISTSANLYGGETVKSWRGAAAVFDGRIDAVIKGGKVYNGTASTIASAENGEVKILRSGGGIQ
jgi:L-threonylcarbamoyladenylate synthase